MSSVRNCSQLPRVSITHLNREVFGADAEQPIEVGTANAAAGAIPIEELVEPQLHHLVVFSFEAVHAAAKPPVLAYTFST